jgi:hypothetical protein
MNEVAAHQRLVQLIERARATLASATTAAEILDARDQATLAYDAAKRAARLAKAKEAHDEVIAACHRAQADALVIVSQAQCRLADEYDAAQKRGEVIGTSGGNPDLLTNRSQPERLATVEDIGLTRKLIHQARRIRDAEKRQPGIVRRTLDQQLAHGEEPSRAASMRAIDQALAPPKPQPAAEPRRQTKPDVPSAARNDVPWHWKTVWYWGDDEVSTEGFSGGEGEKIIGHLRWRGEGQIEAFDLDNKVSLGIYPTEDDALNAVYQEVDLADATAEDLMEYRIAYYMEDLDQVEKLQGSYAELLAQAPKQRREEVVNALRRMAQRLEAIALSLQQR